MEMQLKREQLNNLNTDQLIDFCYRQINIDGDHLEALKFTNALLQYAEERLTTILIELLVTRGFSKISNRGDVMEKIIRDLDWSKKIDVIDNIDSRLYKPLTKYLRKLSTLRNRIFHSKFAQLDYDGKDIRSVETRRDMIFDFVKAGRDAVNNK